MLKKVLVRGFMAVAVVATAAVAVVTVQAAGAGSSGPVVPAQPSAQPSTSFVTSEAGIRTALLSACGGKALVTSVDPSKTDEVDHALAERALHAASLAGNPLSSGTGFQAGVDDALHVQMYDRELAGILCPSP